MSEKLAEEFKFTHVSIQSLLTDFIAENPGDEEAIEVRRKLVSGQNAPDEIANGLLAARLARKDAKDLGVVLVDFPQTDAQLQFMKTGLQVEPSVVFMLECSDSFVLAEHVYVDPLTGKSLTIDQAKASGDHGLLQRITQLARENSEALQKSIERWELTRRNLVKHFEHQTVSINIENRTEKQIIEQLTHILRKKF